MSKHPLFASDDENDTRLFDRWQEFVLEHCPNPERIGCFDHETLRIFVETPEKIDLRDPKYIHVTQCAECTRELQELRFLREDKLRQVSARKSAAVSPLWLRTSAIAASLVAVAVLSMAWKYNAGTSGRSAQEDPAVSAVVDLSADGAPRDAGQEAPDRSISLPHKLISLRLVLPYYSPSGRYRIVVTGHRGLDHVETEGSGSAFEQGARTELQVRLDLRRLAPDQYYLGTALVGDGAPYYYPLTVTR